MNTPEPTKSIPLTREFCLGLDIEDPLSAHRARFQLPQGVIYLDGNSLGALPKSVPQRLREAVEVEWGDGLIRSWNDAAWYPAPQRVGSQIARLIGAGPREVIAADSTSVNLFKVLCAALRMRPGRNVILGEKDNFPTDAYIADGVSRLMGAQFRAVEASDVLDAIDETVAIVSLTHVNYRTGRLYDMAAITARAHEAGALVVWDLCHTAGAMPCDLNGCGADFAVGCGYKYLNGGPGAPAFVFVAERHQEALDQPLSGWHGHAKPFEFVQQYQPATGIDRMLVGTAPQLGLIALEEALHAFDDVDMAALRRKSERMTELFIELVDQELDGFTVATPREATLRGSQVSLAHEHGYAIMQVLIERGVIGDFRAPNILRFGFAVLYLRFADVWDAVAQIKDVMATGAWKSDRYMVRKAVT
ncbi:kynureninase [Variovorax sp. CAN2819]|uniref:kynureninase n=1 Tax=Variovorax sp. CAN15 TaxID=3046727 RepID=UPI00264A04F8|nr:kynureninase [Variovorax sp. CAN15]MDN6883090.1 kynureninase [Variovorax sp. CAN15]